MNPSIQFTRTKQGVRIAYARLSEAGPAVIWTRPPALGMLDGLKLFGGMGTLADQAALTLFDQAGSGASQRADIDVSVESQVSTIEAVADAVNRDGLTIVGTGTAAGGAAAFAAAHEGRVARLVCVNPARVDPDTWDMDFLRRNWSMARRFLAQKAFPDGPVNRQKEHGKAMADAVSHETYVRYHEYYRASDWGLGYFRQVRVPTLVVQHVTNQVERDGLERVLTAMPHCEYIEMRSSAGQASDSTEHAAHVLRFMGLAPRGAAQDGGGTAIILFADIADHTAHTVRLGDAGFREKARPLDEALRHAVRAHGGTVVDGKTLGDGILATFPAAAQAIAAALVLEEAAVPTGLGLHIGLHAGDVLREVDADGRSNVFGSAVSIASRISALAPPGEILVSRTVADLARSSAGVRFEDRGEHALKGIAEPQRVFAVRGA